MTPEQIKSARERMEKATPGPWVYAEGRDRYTHQVRPATRPGTIIASFPQDSSGQAEADARWCANARTDLYAALDALEAAQARIAELESELRVKADIIEATKELTAWQRERIEARDKRIAELENELKLTRGAMAADDERLRVAAERVGLSNGCDAAEWMADEILALRTRVAELERDFRLLDAICGERIAEVKR